MMTPAETLRAAAELLRRRAKGTSRSPWAQPYYVDDEDCPEDQGWWVHNSGVGMAEHAVAVTFALNAHGEADALWIATVHPGLAEPLAAQFDRQADWDEADTGSGDLAAWISDQTDQALPVARAILGGES